MTNLERWQLYMSKVASPDSYIRWGWYSLIASCLQRRVWIGAEEMPIYPNLYVILVGEAGVGKGMVLGPAKDLLRFHRYEKPKVNGHAVFASVVEREEAKKYLAADILEEATSIITSGSRDKEIPKLFPIAPDATTYEALIRNLATSSRPIAVKKFDKVKNTFVDGIYSHCSLSFILEEISSLFRKHTEDVVNFLLTTYDCKHYEYDTKTQGKDVIRRCCVNLLGGTTPSFMQRVFSDELLTEGFASRTMFIYETKNRFSTLFIPDFDPNQLVAYTELREYIKRLSTLYGQVRLTPDAEAFLTDWWPREDSGETRANKSPKLNPYYARKQLHALKLAMAIHFSDSLEMTIPIEPCKLALAELSSIEQRMHIAVTLDNKNPLATLAKKIVRYITKYGPQSKIELVAEFFGESEAGIAGIEQAIDYLIQTHVISDNKKIGGIFKYRLHEESSVENVSLV